MASTADVLLRLVIKGMDPAEVNRLAQQTYGQLASEATRHLERLAALHRAKNEEMTADVRKYNDEAIKATTKALQSVQQLMRQQEIAANQTRNAWRRTMEDLENITTVARGAWDVISSGFERFKGLAEDVIRVNQVMNSGNAGGMGLLSSLVGDISEYDLVIAKNQTMLANLKLADNEFQILAESASAFSDQLGTNAKGALDVFTNAMITGRTRGLQALTGILDEKKATEDYAKSIHKSVDALTEQEQLHAKQILIVDALHKKLNDLGGAQENTAQALETTFTRLDNLWNRLLNSIGNSTTLNGLLGWVSNGLEVNVPTALARMMRESHFKGAGEVANDNAQADAQFEENFKKWRKEAAEKAARQKPAKQGSRFDFDKFAIKSTVDANREEALNPSNPDDVLQGMAGAAVESQAVEGLDKYVEAQQKAMEADEKRYVTLQKTKGISVDAAIAFEKMAQSLGIDTEALTQDERMQALANEAHLKADELADQMQKKADERRAQLKATGDRTGMLGVFLFGVDGPSQTYEEMDDFMQHITDTFGEASTMIKGSANQMSTALATAIGGALTHQAGWKSILHNQTHDILESLATQAGARAIFEGASALAYLATGNFASASLAGASALAFGGLAVTAGIAAHALGTVPTGATAAAAARQGGGVSSSAPSSFGSGGRTSDSGGSDSGAPTQIVLNFNSITTNKEQAGEAVAEFMRAYEEKTGRKLLAA